MAKFVRLTKGLADKGILISPEEIQKHVQNPLIDHYASVYYYNDEHFKQFQQTGSIEGITDVNTNKIWFDFDAKDNLKAAKEDAIELIERLKVQGISSDSIDI
jgi:NDP-sugar pyrophosphorylase family protein